MRLSKTPPVATKKAETETPVVRPPDSVQVEHEYKPVIYLNDKVAIIRRAGF